MKYKLIFSTEVEMQLKKLDNELVKRILYKIVEASEDPKHFFKRLKGREDYKLKIGDFRIIAKITHNEKNIFLISLGHRKNIYKK